MFPRGQPGHSLDAHRGSAPDDRSDKENSRPEQDAPTSTSALLRGSASKGRQATSSIDDKKEVHISLPWTLSLTFSFHFRSLYVTQTEDSSLHSSYRRSRDSGILTDNSSSLSSELAVYWFLVLVGLMLAFMISLFGYQIEGMAVAILSTILPSLWNPSVFPWVLSIFSFIVWLALYSLCYTPHLPLSAVQVTFTSPLSLLHCASKAYSPHPLPQFIFSVVQYMWFMRVMGVDCYVVKGSLFSCLSQVHCIQSWNQVHSWKSAMGCCTFVCWHCILHCIIIFWYKNIAYHYEFLFRIDSWKCMQWGNSYWPSVFITQMLRLSI